MIADRLSRIRLSYVHLLAMTMLCALAIVPLVLAWRFPDPKWLEAAIAFDLTVLPVIAALTVMAVLPPSRHRYLLAAVLCSTPFLLWLIFTVASLPFMFLDMAYEAIIEGDWSRVVLRVLQFGWILWAVFVFKNYLKSLRAKCCPSCGGRKFRHETRIDPIKKLCEPTGLEICIHCGTKIRVIQDGRGSFHLAVAEPPLVQREAKAVPDL